MTKVFAKHAGFTSKGGTGVATNTQDAFLNPVILRVSDVDVIFIINRYTSRVVEMQIVIPVTPVTPGLPRKRGCC